MEQTKMGIFQSANDIIDDCRDVATTTERRYELAKRAFLELSGVNQNGLTLHHVGGHFVIDDGHDRWLILAAVYAEGVAEIAKEIFAGKYYGDEEQFEKNVYETICHKCRAIYSNMAGISTPEKLKDYLVSSDLVSDDDFDKILDLLNVDQ